MPINSHSESSRSSFFQKSRDEENKLHLQVPRVSPALEYLPLLIVPIFASLYSFAFISIGTLEIRFLNRSLYEIVTGSLVAFLIAIPVAWMAKLYNRHYHLSFITICRIFSPIHWRRPVWAGSTKFHSVGGFNDSVSGGSIVNDAVLTADSLVAGEGGVNKRFIKRSLSPKLKKDVIWFFTAKLWYFTIIATTIVSIFVTDSAYYSYAYSNYEYRLNSVYYGPLDASKISGEAVMDAGIVWFDARTVVNHTASFKLKMENNYCIAPIVPGNNNTAVHERGYPFTDFFAVGINCCDDSETASDVGQGYNFKCGDVLNPNANSGMRLVRRDLRPMFYLAYEAWGSRMNLSATMVKSRHPIFLIWTVDPLGYLSLNDDYIMVSKLVCVCVCTLLAVMIGGIYRQTFK